MLNINIPKYIKKYVVKYINKLLKLQYGKRKNYHFYFTHLHVYMTGKRVFKHANIRGGENLYSNIQT